MLTIFSEDHEFQNGRSELTDGQLVRPFERPERARMIIERVREMKLGDIEAPIDMGLDPIRRIHDPGLVDFLAVAWDLWAAEGRENDALPLCWQVRGLNPREPESIDGKLSYFSFDAGTPITPGTWRAVRSSANTALTGAAWLIRGEKAVFSLCRPPGHHAHADVYGGYCFLNNAAIAAQHLLDGGCARVSIIDVDYHHGNGTQSIFYNRPDVQFLSIHADPRHEFPFFLGHVDERGQAAGRGHNFNYPLPWGTGWDRWSVALQEVLDEVDVFAPDALVVSLGVDTFEKDPISQFTLGTDCFPRIGEALAGINRPVLFVMEGGYAIDEVGVNVVNVLTGFEQANGI
ncbi:MAG: histone deacetylase family protein [Alphaproteobacteria bacterium]|nr:histone deacetylase family protein [Alphaproteobacteria bacterium SS10]